MSSYIPDYPADAQTHEERFVKRASVVTTALIAINVVVFLLERSHGALLLRLGVFTVGSALVHGQLWRFITFQFLHASTTHILFNMMALYVFGPLVETYLGSWRYLVFYLLCGIGGALFYVVLWAVGLLHEGPYSYMLGASAGIFGVIIAAARIAPDARVMLLIPPIPLKLTTLAWILVAIAVASVLFHFNNAGGEAAHLGGAAVGLLLMRSPTFLGLFPRRRSFGEPPMRDDQ